MTQKLTVCLLLTLLTGCDWLEQPQSSKPAEQPIKWAVVEKHKLDEAMGEAVAKANPEIAADKKQYAEAATAAALAMGQIAEITRSLKQKCDDYVVNNNKNAPPKPEPEFRVRSGGPVPPVSQAEMILRGDPVYAECLKKIPEDPLLRDLQAKLDSFNVLEKGQNNRSGKLREQVDKALATILAAYGQQHGYQLIISKNGQELLFNKSNLVLDITPDVLDFIAKHPVAAPSADAPAPQGQP